MDMDLEPITLLVTGGMWAFILFLLWVMPFGFSGMREKILMTILSLPIIYGIVVWQKNR